jgi:hypothetical protein
MYFNGLSQNECDEIKRILDSESIPYEVSVDKERLELNESQKKEALAHYLPGRVSTDLLRIKLKDKDFQSLSDNALHLLQELGVYSSDEPHPSEFEVYNEENPDYLREHQAKKERFINTVLITVLLVIAFTYALMIIWE